MKMFLGMPIFIWLTLIALVFIVVASIFMADRAFTEMKKNYEKPDTTITITNGKADTIITKKSAPKWMQ